MYMQTTLMAHLASSASIWRQSCSTSAHSSASCVRRTRHPATPSTSRASLRPCSSPSSPSSCLFSARRAPTSASRARLLALRARTSSLLVCRLRLSSSCILRSLSSSSSLVSSSQASSATNPEITFRLVCCSCRQEAWFCPKGISSGEQASLAEQVCGCGLWSMAGGAAWVCASCALRAAAFRSASAHLRSASSYLRSACSYLRSACSHFCLRSASSWRSLARAWVSWASSSTACCSIEWKSMGFKLQRRRGLNAGINLTEMGKSCQLQLEDFVAGVLQLVAQCDVEDYELKAIRKISRKQTRMVRHPTKDPKDRENHHDHTAHTHTRKRAP